MILPIITSTLLKPLPLVAITRFVSRRQLTACPIRMRARIGRFKRYGFLFSLLVLVSSHSPYAQADYGVHANIIYHFTKYIDWPEYKKTGDFIIGIVGESPLFDELKGFGASKMAGSQRIVVKRFPASASAFNCHILFISEDESGSMKKIVASTAGTPTLIVSEAEGLARKGSCINFIIVSDHLKLEINKNNIEQRNLSIATELLGLGILVK